MNTVQLAQRLSRHLKFKDLATLPAEVAADLVAAMNAGLQRLYSVLPDVYKQTTVSHTLRAPVSVSFSIDQYSNEADSAVFTESQRGCTIRIGSEANDNEIVSTSEVLDEYLGASGEVTAQIWHDTAVLEDVVERVMSDVRLYDRDGSRTVLVRDALFRERNADNVGSRPGTYARRSVGRPKYYDIEPVGVSQGGEPEYFLRVTPMPDIDYIIRFEAQLSPRQLTFRQLSEPARIALNDRMCESLLVPLCESAMTSSEFWEDKSSVGRVSQSASDVLQFYVPKTPADIGRTANKAYTPRGF